MIYQVDIIPYLFHSKSYLNHYSVTLLFLYIAFEINYGFSTQLGYVKMILSLFIAKKEKYDLKKVSF